MPGDPGGGGWGGGGGHGRGNSDGGRRRPAVKERQGNEEIRKFLNFYKRKNSLCVDLYLPAFFQRKPNYDDLAEFVYSVLSVGGTMPPNVIRAAVLDIQLHPVKKLLFIKFSDQMTRDDVVGRLQAGLNWPSFDTTVSGWSMDKPIERIRVLGTSPETNEVEIRLVLGQYGEILEAQKGLISKKLPGCTNGIWTVKMFLGEGKVLPPFLIMKDDGEVWQLATGEASVCWKCGQSGHIGDKCRQAVNVLADSLASPAVGVQPSWAHIVKGGVSLVVPPPAVPPPRPQPQQQLIFLKLSRGTLRAGKASLKTVQKPVIKRFEQLGKVVMEQARAVDETVVVQETLQVEAASMDVQFSGVSDKNVEVEERALPATAICPMKKVKLSSGEEVPRDPRLRNKGSVFLSSSPELHHKVPAGVGEQQHVVGGEGSGTVGDEGLRSNMYGVNFVLWFEVSIEGKDSMDSEEEDWGGRLEFGFKEKTFSVELEDYFLMFEDDCSITSHNCVGRIMGVLMHKREGVLQPPSYDTRNIVELVDKYRDAHILDSGWREVDPEEWHCDVQKC